MGHEQFQQPVFLGGEVHLDAVAGDAAFILEQAQVVVLQHLAAGRGGGGAAQQGPAAGHQFAHAEGLDQVVVGPHFQPEHPVGFAVTGAHHQDRRLVLGGAQLAAHVQTPQPRQHQVEHHQGVTAALGGPLDRLQGIASVAAGGDLKTLQLQGVADGFADRFVVLDDQQPGLHRSILAGGGLKPEAARVSQGSTPCPARW